MLFCPICNNSLLVSFTDKGYRFYCNTCDYYYPLLDKLKNIIVMQKKQAEDILGGEDTWKNVDQTTEICPKCSHNRAYYMQKQIRSADEPSSIFYKCVSCGNQWTQN